MVYEKRVPRLDWAVVDENPHRGWAHHEPVENKSKVPAHADYPIKETLLVPVALRVLTMRKSVEVLPENDRAMCLGGQRPQVGPCSGIREAQKPPVVGGSDDVEIPAASLHRSADPTAAYSQAAALGDGRRFQTKSKAAEIVRRPPHQRPACAQAHRLNEFFACHAMSIISHGYDRRCASPLEAEPNMASAGSDTIVHKIRERSGQVVAESTETLDDGRGMWRCTVESPFGHRR